MPKSEIKSKEEEMDEKKPQVPDNQPTPKDGLAQEYAPDATSEADRILGMTKEYSGWDVYNNEARKVDNELVKDWATSLNFLLIFAAIFAAVLTAFIIESKRMLEPDPMKTMVDVMIFYTNNVANGTLMPYTRTEFEADTSAVVVNCLFFTSLSASLFAALASVVALQWVADYDAAITRGGSSPEDRAKRRQFRHAGVISWKMSEIIAALPLLLYFSVILFFAGLILWMWVTSHAVGAVVAAGTAVAVLFYVSSTMIAVAFVSAPFRTPLSRWIYSLFYLPSSVLYWLLRAMRLPTIPSWVKTRHALYTAPYRREDQAVEERETLGRDALIWLANQLSISQDSYRRLLLLVGELPSLKAEHQPSFDSTEASWYQVFDLLGWRYLRRDSSAIVSRQEKKREMEILQRCYKLSVIQKLVEPVEREDLAEDNHEHYWEQYCDSAEDGQWMISHDRPNYLFLLLRDIPCPSQFSSQEIEVTARLSQWRNQAKKDAHAWDEVFSDATSLPSEFFSACVTTFGKFCSGKEWILSDIDERQLYTSAVRKAGQIAAQRDDLLPVATVPLIRAYEALLIGYLSRWSSPSYPTSPFQYGRVLERGSADDHTTHAHMTLLLSRKLHSSPEGETASQAKNVIEMLWLRPPNPVSRDWGYLLETHNSDIPVGMTSDWIRNAESVPHILEILQHLARAQRLNPAIGPLWRTTAHDEVQDPHFVEALQTFDRLMGMDCTDDGHYLLVNLVCQDLELEPYADFNHYFTPSRLESLALLKDHCLRVLVECARGPDFLGPVAVPGAYGQARKRSLSRVAEHVHKRCSSINSPAALQLQASLWPMTPRSPYEEGIYRNAMQDTMFFDLLRRMFKYPVPCYECLDGPGHLVSHLLSTGWFLVTQNVTIFGKLPLDGRYMPVTSIILSTLDEDETFSLAYYFPEVDEHILLTLEEKIHEITSSQFLLLVMIWNTLEVARGAPDHVGAIVVGIRKALRLPYDSRATLILGPLSLRLLRIRNDMSASGYGSFTERELVTREATITSQLLLTNLAVRSIFGQLNSRRISCARAVGYVQPALGWLPPFDW